MRSNAVSKSESLVKKLKGINIKIKEASMKDEPIQINSMEDLNELPIVGEQL